VKNENVSGVVRDHGVLRLVLKDVVSDGIDNPDENWSVEWVSIQVRSQVVNNERNPKDCDSDLLFINIWNIWVSHTIRFEHVTNIQDSSSSDPSTVNAESSSHGDELSLVDWAINGLNHHEDVWSEHGDDVDKANSETPDSIGLENNQPNWVNHHICEEMVTNVSKNELVISLWNQTAWKSLICDKSAK